MGGEIVGVLIALAIIIGLAFYFLPTIIAGSRHKSNFAAIFALNLLLGWSLIGWVVSLVWALTQDAKPVIVEINNSNTGGKN
jgi:hypothetical protein